MRDIRELPGDTEQATGQATKLKPRTTSSPKTGENATTGSQEQETRPAPRRRTNTATHALQIQQIQKMEQSNKRPAAQS